MNWKKILKYFAIIFVIATLFFVFSANRNLKKIYGGLTQKVDYNQFNLPNGDFAITNVNILSPDSKSFIPNQTIYIKEGIIASIDSFFDPASSFDKIDGGGKFLIPGLIDSHVHLFKSSNDLLLYVANGVTQIREMIGEKDHLKWKDEIKDGRLGPDMFIASPRLGTFGSFEGWFMEWSQGFSNIKTPAEAEKKVKKFNQKGYDAVKIYSQLSKECYYAVDKVADSLGMKVVGHVPWGLRLSDIWRSHQCEIAHLEELMNALNREFDYYNSQEHEKFLAFVEKRSKEIAVELIKEDITITTTLWLTESFVRQKFELNQVLKEIELEYENPGISEWTTQAPQGLGWLPHINRYKLPDGLTEEELIRRKKFWETYAKACQVILKNLVDGGVKIVAGTDANLPPTVPGFSLHDELISLNNAGMTSAQVLHSATTEAANWLETNTGKIEKGRIANLVLLDSNPLNDISNTKKINTVILKGKILDRNVLDQILAAVKEANDKSRKVDISRFLN